MWVKAVWTKSMLLVAVQLACMLWLIQTRALALVDGPNYIALVDVHVPTGRISMASTTKSTDMLTAH